MSTPSTARQHANERNAQQSTGSRTPEGKSASSQNSRTHGLTVSNDALARQYPAAYETLRAEYARVYPPQDQIMHDLLHQLASARLRLNRASELETLALQNEPNLDQLNLLLKLERYRKSAEASYHRALKELKAAAQVHQEALAAARKLEARSAALAYGEKVYRQELERHSFGTPGRTSSIGPSSLDRRTTGAE